MRDPRHFGIPKKMKSKKRKAKNDEAVVRPLPTPTRQLTIKKNAKGEFIGVDGGFSIGIAEGRNVQEGQVWRCSIGELPIGDIAVPVDILSEGITAESSEKSIPEDSEDVSTTMEESQPMTPTFSSEIMPTESEFSRLQEENQDLRAKLNDLVKANNRFSEEVKRIPLLEDQLKDVKKANSSLKEQVKNLEKKCKMDENTILAKERDRVQDLCRNKDEKIAELMEIIDLYQTESRSNPNIMSTYLTGSTGIHCNHLDDRRYRVYFSPGKRTLRFIPDDEGVVISKNHEVTLPGISGYTGYERIRKLDVKVDGDNILVALG